MSGLDARAALLHAVPIQGLFASSAQVTLLDHFRVAYEVDPRLAADRLEQLCVRCGGPSLMWSRTSGSGGRAVRMLGADRETEIPLFAKVLPDSEVKPLLADRGGAWRPVRTLSTPEGAYVSSIWVRDDGSVFLPFDPNEVVVNYWSERYLQIGPGSRLRHLRRRLMLGYYYTRPFVPRSVQIALRRHYAHVQARSSFPRWPIETCLHDFFDLMFAILAGIAGEPIPRIASWPHGHVWALVLTHDVETANGAATLDPVLEVERARGVRSSWNFVPSRYEVDPARVSELVRAGFEVGVHGLYHDGRDLESLTTWRSRLPHAHSAADRWGAVGFRSAAMHRHWDWMRLLCFDYDSSCPDTDPFEPQDGGCCTWLPFFNGGLVELPLTLPQDHTLFVILRQHDERTWIEKAEFLRRRGGLALINTHPDYLVEEQILGAYTSFLDRYAADPTAWRALPRDVSSWWRRRAESWLEHDGDGWRIAGPAADEGSVEFVGGTW